MGWTTYNDRLALVLILLIPALWLVQAIGSWALPSEVNGALIVAWTLVLQYYFRRSPPAPPDVSPGPASTSTSAAPAPGPGDPGKQPGSTPARGG